MDGGWIGEDESEDKGEGVNLTCGGFKLQREHLCSPS
jgi:hypothetical protein